MLSYNRVVTGIGKALAGRLAQQGLNILLVALDDPLLDQTYVEMKSKYPEVTVRKVETHLDSMRFDPLNQMLWLRCCSKLPLKLAVVNKLQSFVSPRPCITLTPIQHLIEAYIEVCLRLMPGLRGWWLRLGWI